MAGLGFTALMGCATKFRTYAGPPITEIRVYKERRKMQMLSQGRLVRNFDFELGFAPTGDKSVEGDGRTPEGAYFIDRKNPNSRFYLSVGISYPNAADRAYAHSLGQSPGGDIFIHGTPNPFSNEDDWTWGCIAVTNREMEDVYAMTNIGTPIYLYP